MGHEIKVHDTLFVLCKAPSQPYSIRPESVGVAVQMPVDVGCRLQTLANAAAAIEKKYQQNWKWKYSTHTEWTLEMEVTGGMEEGWSGLAGVIRSFLTV